MVKFPIDRSDKREIGKTGEYVSAIGLGTWAIRDYNRALETFVYAIEHGIDNIDTAEMYDNGKAEEMVGEVIRCVGRDKVFVTTKLLPEHVVSKDAVLKATKACLKRLGVSEVDLLLIHWPNPSLTISEQVRNLEEAFNHGLTRYIGVSNFEINELKEAISSTRKAEIVVDQVHYSIIHKNIEEHLLQFAIKEKITIQAYSPLERGEIFRHRKLSKVAEKVGKTLVQVALNYIISRPRTIALVKTENIVHLEEILGSMGWRLSTKHIEELEKL
ncbi:MAG: oxidoreductase [Desulfurococcales archaeon ex4484_217_2]|nr:MAG: oxidoreductase [Desulfurococcales archaeon ex4484_217_2]